MAWPLLVVTGVALAIHDHVLATGSLRVTFVVKMVVVGPDHAGTLTRRRCARSRPRLTADPRLLDPCAPRARRRGRVAPPGRADQRRGSREDGPRPATAPGQVPGSPRQGVRERSTATERDGSVGVGGADGRGEARPMRRSRASSSCWVVSPGIVAVVARSDSVSGGHRARIRARRASSARRGRGGSGGLVRAVTVPGVDVGTVGFPTRFPRGDSQAFSISPRGWWRETCRPGGDESPSRGGRGGT